MTDMNKMLSDMTDVLNMPSKSFGDIEPMEVCNYRHEAYRVWEPLNAEIKRLRVALSLTREGVQTDDAIRIANEHK